MGQVVTRAQIAEMLLRNGKPDEANAQIKTAESMLDDSLNSKVRVDILLVDAATRLALGEVEQSVNKYREGMAISRSTNDRASQAEIYASIGWVYQSVGKSREALLCYEDALTLFTTIGDKDGEAKSRLAIASLYQALGDYGQAEEQYLKAISMVSGQQLRHFRVSYASMLELQQRPLKALLQYEDVLPFARSQSESSWVGAILTGMARCHTALGYYETAQQELYEAFANMRDANNRSGEAAVLASLGEVSYWMGMTHYLHSSPHANFSKSIEYYTEALTIMRSVGERLGEIGVLCNTGLVYDAWGKPQQALSFYHDALRLSEDIQNFASFDEFRVELANQSAPLYQRAIALEAKLHHIPEAFDLTERARARAFLDLLGNSRILSGTNGPTDLLNLEAELRSKDTLTERQLTEELSKPGSTVDLKRVGLLRDRLSSIRKQHQTIIADLNSRNPKYSAYLSIAPLTVTAAQSILHADETLISYFTTPSVTLAFVITHDRVYLTQLKVTEEQLKTTVATLLDFPDEHNTLAALETLYSWLIAPINSKLRTPKIGIIPHGDLNDVPFAALTHDGRQYFGERYILFVAPSVSALSYIELRDKPNGNKVMVLANNEDGFPNMVHAYDEAREVANFWDVRPYLNDDATAYTIQANAGKHNILHLIAHIDLDAAEPLSSRLVLHSTRTADGSLRLRDVFNLSLESTSLVVLSGCNSQRGERTQGDDVTSFSRAFLYAGSPSVIASLWSIDDDATQFLMKAFYEHLRTGSGKAEALHDAQVDARTKYPNPYYWSGFVLMGDPGRRGEFSLASSLGK